MLSKHCIKQRSVIIPSGILWGQVISWNESAGWLSFTSAPPCPATHLHFLWQPGEHLQTGRRQPLSLTPARCLPCSPGFPPAGGLPSASEKYSSRWCVIPALAFPDCVWFNDKGLKDDLVKVVFYLSQPKYKRGHQSTPHSYSQMGLYLSEQNVGKEEGRERIKAWF